MTSQLNDTQRRLEAWGVVRQARQSRKPHARMEGWADVLGRKIGRWNVLEFAYRKAPHNFMKCRCDCGVERLVTTNALRTGKSLSCGCLRSDLKLRLKYDVSHRPEYKVWRSMRNRCNTASPRNHCYHGRGIAISPEWNEFLRFYADMGPRPSPAHTIERVDNDKGYSADNCVWATCTQQARNRRGQRRYTFGSESLLIAEWAERLNIPSTRIWARLNVLGWTVERALTTP